MPDDDVTKGLSDKQVAVLDRELSGLPPLKVVTAAELLSMDFPAREFILEPILQTQGTMMLYSKRGVGKTYLSLGFGCAVAAGAKFLRWTAPKPRGNYLR